MFQKPGFDLAQLHAGAADLHLMVGAAKEVQAPFRIPAGKVSGLVQPQPRNAIAGIGGREEPFIGQVGAIEIALREAVSGNEHLADDPDGVG